MGKKAGMDVGRVKERRRERGAFRRGDLHSPLSGQRERERERGMGEYRKLSEMKKRVKGEAGKTE